MLQLQHRDDVGTRWGAERAVQMRTDQAVWLGSGWGGKYRLAAGGQRWWGWHMTWQADKGGGPSQEGVRRSAARRRTGCDWGANTIH